MEKYKIVPFNVTIPNDSLCWGYTDGGEIGCKYFDTMLGTRIGSVKCWLGFKIVNEGDQGFYRPEACVVLSQKEEVEDAGV